MYLLNSVEVNQWMEEEGDVLSQFIIIDCEEDVLLGHAEEIGFEMKVKVG